VALSPSVTGTVTSYSISPALPAGLQLNAATGVISGTPTELSLATNYTITATNSSGSTTFVVSIAVSAVVDNTVYLVHYWNFNTLPTGPLTSIPADVSLLSTTTNTISYAGSGAGYLDQVSPGSTLNTQNCDLDGLGLRARNPSDTRSLIISASTLGYKNIVVKFATDRTSSGATVQNYSYTIDGTNYITSGLTTTTFSPNIDPNYDVITLDFSSIAAVVNNPNFKIKIDFGGTTATGTSGNNRFDNITFQGNIL
jgi:Putative Ig domain